MAAASLLGARTLAASREILPSGYIFLLLTRLSVTKPVRASASPTVAAERSTTVWHERCPYVCGQQRCPGRGRGAGEQRRSVPVVGNRDVPSYLPGFFSLPSSSCLCLKQRRLKDSSVRNTDLFYMTAHKRPSPNSAHTLSVCITSSLHTPVGRLFLP